jgi:hypothetical protein
MRIEQGEEPEEVVAEVVHTVFGGVPASADLDRTPDSGETGPEQAIALINDPDRLDRIVATVAALIRGRPRSPDTMSDDPLDRPSET